jgi:rubrerythrin
MNYFNQNQPFQMPQQNMNMPANSSMSMPPGMPPCMATGQYNIMPGATANIIPQANYMDEDDMANGMFPGDLPLNLYNIPASNNGFPISPFFMPVNNSPIGNIPMNNIPLMGNMLNNLLNNMPMFNIHETASSPSVKIKSKDLQDALGLIKEAVSGESEDRLFYEYLISVAPNDEEKNLIKGIRDDEVKHFGYFRDLYKDLTGSTLPATSNGEFKKPKSYCEGLKDALLGEQRAVRKYRKILAVLTERSQINKLIEIITDELRHGIIYNYLYSRNKCDK